MEVTLLGTGSSHGVPVLGCACATCERARQRDIERMRFSVHVRNERTDETLLVDASPDLKRQLAPRNVSFPDELLVTHMHFDHHAGLGELNGVVDSLPIHAADDTDITVPDPAAGARSVAEAIEDRYGYTNQSVSSTHHCPVSERVDWTSLWPGSITDRSPATVSPSRARKPTPNSPSPATRATRSPNSRARRSPIPICLSPRRQSRRASTKRFRTVASTIRDNDPTATTTARTASRGASSAGR